MKFGAMYEKAKELGCDYIATGHYAKIEWSDKYNQNVLKNLMQIKKIKVMFYIIFQENF